LRYGLNYLICCYDELRLQGVKIKYILYIIYIDYINETLRLLLLR